MMYEKTVEYGQDLFDVSIQEYGTIEAVFMVLEDNTGIDLEGFLEPGTAIKFRHDPPADIVDAEVMEYFRKNEIRCNNGEEPPADGTDYWDTIEDGPWQTEDDENWQTL
jgi:hypothetical protein